MHARPCNSVAVLLSIAHLLYHATAGDGLLVGATGLEQTAIATQKPHISPWGAAKSAATSVAPGQPDPDLAHLADSWSRLPPTIKAGIVAMVKAVTNGDHNNKMAPGS